MQWSGPAREMVSFWCTLGAMIRQVTGIVADTAPLAVVVDVNGIGYLVYTTTGLAYAIGSQVQFHTHLAVRETALDLYGFTSRDELDIFELLLTIPKIGPKSALDILSKADVTTLRTAITNGDPSYLTKVSGIGKKTAEKIVSELADALAGLAAISVATPMGTIPHFTSDAIDALVALGYPPVDARKAVLQLPPSVTSANEAVREALKLLGQA